MPCGSGRWPLHNARDRLAALKRGGNQRFIPWDLGEVEDRYQAQPAEHLTPEKAYAKRWAATLLQEVLDRLREDFQATGRAELFERLKGHLWARVALD
jgi:hypothetical protein